MSKQKKLDGVATTRMNLLELRSKEKLAQHGHDLLKEKMDALIIEFYAVLDEVKTAQGATADAIAIAHNSLRYAGLRLGVETLNNLGLNAPSVLSLHTTTHNIMGVKVPRLNLKERIVEYPFYDAETTNVAFDVAVTNFRKSMNTVVALAEKLATLQKLAYEINGTKRRVNALNHIIIPRLNNTATFIALALEEEEREVFSRLKFIKNKIEMAKKEKLQV